MCMKYVMRAPYTPVRQITKSTSKKEERGGNKKKNAFLPQQESSSRSWSDAPDRFVTELP